MTDLQKLLDEATPGPWAVNKYCSVGAGRFGISPILATPLGLWGREDVQGNHAANARLIAQAPDLARRVLELEAAIRCVVESHDYIQRGEIYRDDGVLSKHDNCVHGLPIYNGCEACVWDFLSKALDSPPEAEGVE